MRICCRLAAGRDVSTMTVMVAAVAEHSEWQRPAVQCNRESVRRTATTYFCCFLVVVATACRCVVLLLLVLLLLLLTCHLRLELRLQLPNATTNDYNYCSSDCSTACRDELNVEKENWYLSNGVSQGHREGCR